jgi:small subunit ribosomal protein S17
MAEEETPENVQDEAAIAAGEETSEAAGAEAPPAAAPPAPAAAPRRAPAARAPLTPQERAEARVTERRAKAAQRRRYRAKLKVRRSERRAGAPAAEPQVAGPTAGGRPKVRQGIVVSAKADKTITVRIDIARRHRRYRKILRSSMTLHAHDERNDAREGDTVRVQECRPMSRTKRWRLLDVVERAR